MRRLRRLAAVLVALAAIVPAAAAPNSMRSAASLPSGWWQSEPSQPLNIDVTESLPNGGCEQIVGIEQTGQQSVLIQNATGAVTVKPDTPLPHVGFVGLTDNPAVGPGGTIHFTLTLNMALPPSTVVTVANFPQCGVGTGSQAFDLVFAPAPPRPPPPPPPPPNPTPNLDVALAEVMSAMAFERKADTAYAEGLKKTFHDSLEKATKALNIALGATLQAHTTRGEITTTPGLDQETFANQLDAIELDVRSAYDDDAEANNPAIVAEHHRTTEQKVKFVTSTLRVAELFKQRALKAIKQARATVASAHK